MYRSFQALSAVALITVIIGCGKSPLTDEQRAQFQEVTSSSNKVISSAQSAQKAKGTTALAKSAVSGDEFQTRLSQANCDFTVPTPDGSDLSKMASINMTVGGTNCPMKMQIGITKKSENSGEFVMSFEITDEELAKLSDVTKYDLRGVISGDAGGASGTMEGSITSKKHGIVPIRMTMNFNAGGGSIEVSYTFPTFTAIVEVNVTEDGATFKLNGQDISQQEFSEFGGAPGASVPTATNESSSSYSYTLTENGCSTQKQSFSSKEAMCEGLKNDSLNHYCAESLRRNRFTSDGCSGSFDL